MKKYFKDFRTAIPFGKYESGSEDEFPENESMIGREGARAKLIGFLNNTGIRGAILVTGRRGMGKTKFVEHCIHEYKSSYYERYLSGRLIRNFKSLIWLIMIVLLISLVFIIDIRFMESIVNMNFMESTLNINLMKSILNAEIKDLSLLPIKVLLLLIVIYPPAIYSFKIIQTISEINYPKTRRILYIAFFITLYTIIILLFFKTLIFPISENNKFSSELILWLIPSILLHYYIHKESPRINLFFLFITFTISYLYFNLNIDSNIFVLLSFILISAASISRIYSLEYYTNKTKNSDVKKTLKQAINSFENIMYISCVIATIYTSAYFIQSNNITSNYIHIILLLCSISTIVYYIIPKNKKYDNKKHPRNKLYKTAIDLMIIKSIIIMVFSALILALIFIPNTITTKTNDDINLIFLTTYIILIIYLLEYELIVKPSSLSRKDTALYNNQALKFDIFENIKNDDINKSQLRENLRKIEKHTFFNILCYFHIHSIICTINLGFEKLDHKSVIHGMLLTVRNQFYDKFLSNTSPRVIVRQIFILLICMPIVSQLSKNSFLQNDEKTISNHKVIETTPSDCIIDEPNPSIISFFTIKNNIYCSLYYKIIYIPILKNNNSELIINSLFFNLLFDIQRKCEVPNSVDINLYKENYSIQGCGYCDYEISFRIYHLCLFLWLFFLLSFFNKIYTIVPYRNILNKIDDLLDQLTTTRTNRQRKQFKLSLINTSNDYLEDKSTKRDSTDPRIVELIFLDLLEEIVSSKSWYTRFMSTNTTVSNLEVTFIFDELDKLATKTDSITRVVDNSLDKASFDDPYSNDLELYRLSLMKDLLSDMKRIITSSHARFIFIGGRLLHDDWLADGTRRQPLLTSIFTDEIYLPSLLTDTSINWFLENNEKSKKNQPGFDNRIKQFLILQYNIAHYRYLKQLIKGWLLFPTLKDKQTRSRSFLQNNIEDKISKMPIFACDETNTGYQILNSKIWEGQKRGFIYFLTYRSNGNPKRLNELLASFIVNKDRHLNIDIAQHDDFACQDILYFPDTKMYRIQSIARLYRRLRNGFESKLKDRDDKAITSLIYLSDFLIKFHKRAFSWESLELIDEITHLHRGHDLRALLNDLVDYYSDRYLHHIINGMYSYRFYSEFSSEIQYLSSQSEEEMAAFNFTLDESQTLRANLISHLDAKNINATNTDVLSMLGELHECYQEYEQARDYYNRCINKWDELLRVIAGDKLYDDDGNQHSTLFTIYTNTVQGKEGLTVLLQWGPQKLRMLLKIAMSYELVKNYDEALLRYRQCIKFSEVMLKTFSSMHSGSYKHLIDHLGILFEPLFAYSWLLEKHTSYIHSSEYLESSINSFYRIIKGRNQLSLQFIKSQCDKKIGAFYFFKGKSISKNNNETTTFLNKAKYEYLRCANHLATYSSHEYVNNENQESVNILNEIDCYVELILDNPFSCDTNLAISECLSNISDCLLAEIEPHFFFYHIENYKFSSPDLHCVIKKIDQWFKKTPSEDTNIINFIKYWESSYINHRLSIISNFDLALCTSFSSAIYLHRAGYVEASTRQLTRSINAILQLLNFYWLINFDSSPSSSSTTNSKSLIYFVSISVTRLESFIKYITWAMRAMRGKSSIQQKDPYLLGYLLPNATLTTVCSIRLSLELFKDLSDDINHKLDEIDLHVAFWLKGKNSKYNKHIDYVEEIEEYLKRHRYPILDQLNSLIALLSYKATKIILCDLNTNNSLQDKANEKLQDEAKEKIENLFNLTAYLSNLLKVEDFPNVENSFADDLLKEHDLLKSEKILIYNNHNNFKTAKKLFNKIKFDQNYSSLLDITDINNALDISKRILESSKKMETFLKNIDELSINNFYKISTNINITVLSIAAIALFKFTDFLFRTHDIYSHKLDEFKELSKISETLLRYTLDLSDNIDNSSLNNDITTNAKNLLNTTEILSKTLKAILKYLEISLNTYLCDISSLVEEIYLIKEKYSQDLHFTPMQIGHAFFLVCRIEQTLKDSNDQLDISILDLRAETRLNLTKSIEMCYMGRAHFIEIDKLYYLYDDFNDNIIHRNLALQMTGVNITKKLLEVLRNKCFEEHLSN